MHAALCREWKGRVKGRDLYDVIWFIARSTPLNLHYLEQRMVQSGHLKKSSPLTRQDLIQLLQQKIDTLDIASAKADIINFIKSPSQVEIWSKDFFYQVIDKIIT